MCTKPGVAAGSEGTSRTSPSPSSILVTTRSYRHNRLPSVMIAAPWQAQQLPLVLHSMKRTPETASTHYASVIFVATHTHCPAPLLKYSDESKTALHDRTATCLIHIHNITTVDFTTAPADRGLLPKINGLNRQAHSTPSLHVEMSELPQRLGRLLEACAQSDSPAQAARIA